MQVKVRSIRFEYLLYLLVGLILADGVVTEYVVGHGLAWESNPFLGGLLLNGLFMPAKILGCLLVIFILMGVHERQPKMAAAVSWCFIVMYTCIVYWNIGGAFILASVSTGGI